MGRDIWPVPRWKASYTWSAYSIILLVFTQIHDFQEKPELDDPEVLYCRIPDSVLAIRIWSGGMEQYGQYCFDFFDVVQRIPVNTPDGHVITFSAPYQTPTKLVSWEAANMDKFPAGTEKYSTLEGSRLVLTRPGKIPYHFQIPRRPSAYHNGVAFVQPQAGVPY